MYLRRNGLGHKATSVIKCDHGMYTTTVSLQQFFRFCQFLCRTVRIAIRWSEHWLCGRWVVFVLTRSRSTYVSRYASVWRMKTLTCARRQLSVLQSCMISMHSLSKIKDFLTVCVISCLIPTQWLVPVPRFCSCICEKCDVLYLLSDIFVNSNLNF